MFIYGSRYYGKVDVVPGLFHVATKFYHFDFIPLIPAGSMLVLCQSGNKLHGVSIPLDGKSVLMAWGRLAALFGIIMATIAVFIVAKEVPVSAAVIAGIDALMIAALIASYMWKPLSHAKYDRACELAGLAKFTPAEMESLRAAFGMDPDYSHVHGFPVESADPATSEVSQAVNDL